MVTSVCNICKWAKVSNFVRGWAKTELIKSIKNAYFIGLHCMSEFACIFFQAEKVDPLTVVHACISVCAGVLLSSFASNTPAYTLHRVVDR